MRTLLMAKRTLAGVSAVHAAPPIEFADACVDVLSGRYRHAEAMEGMALDGGFKITVNAVDYGTDYIPKIRDANGQYDGIAFHSVTGTTPWRLHPISALAAPPV